MPPGLREATAFAARLFAALLPAPGASTVAVTGGGTASAAEISAAAKSAAARSLAKGAYSALLPPLGGWLGGAAAAKGAATAANAAAAAAAAEAVEADVRLACRVVSAAVLGSQAAGGLVLLILLSLRPRLTHHRPSTAMRWALGLVMMAAAGAWTCMARGDWNEVASEDATGTVALLPSGAVTLGLCYLQAAATRRCSTAAHSDPWWSFLRRSAFPTWTSSGAVPDPPDARHDPSAIVLHVLPVTPTACM